MDLSARLLDRARVTRPKADHLTVVTFHRVLPEPLRPAYPFPEIAVTPEELDWHLAYFTRRYTCVTLREAHRRWAGGERPARPFLAVTFDDGQLDNAEHAAPVLARHGVHASFFLPVDAVERDEPLWHDRLGFAVAALAAAGRTSALEGALRDEGLDAESARSASTPGKAARAVKGLPPERVIAIIARVASIAGPEGTVPSWSKLMGWDGARSLSRAGHEIGSHSMSHPILPRCTDAQKKHEIETSQRILAEKVEDAIDSFCYPNGDSDAATEAVVRAAGYERAVTTRWGTNAPGADPLTLRRCDMDARRLRIGESSALSAPMLAWRMSGLHPGVRGL